MIRPIIRITLGDVARVQHGLLGQHDRLRLVPSVGVRPKCDLTKASRYFLQMAQVRRLSRQYYACSAR